MIEAAGVVMLGTIAVTGVLINLLDILGEVSAEMRTQQIMLCIVGHLMMSHHASATWLPHFISRALFVSIPYNSLVFWRIYKGDDVQSIFYAIVIYFVFVFMIIEASVYMSMKREINLFIEAKTKEK